MFKQVLSVLLLVLLLGCGGGSIQSELPIHNYSRPAYRSPNYHPYASPSHAYWWDDQIHVGGDVEPKEKLRKVVKFGDFTVFQGASRDGVGVNRLKNYERDLLSAGNGFYPFKVKPKIWMEDDFYRQLINDDPSAEKLLQAEPLAKPQGGLRGVAKDAGWLEDRSM